MNLSELVSKKTMEAETILKKEVKGPIVKNGTEQKEVKEEESLGSKEKKTNSK